MPTPPNRNIATTTWLGLGALLLLAWFVYRPGLGGGFVFDDFVNLDKLGAGGRVDDWAAFWRYLTSGTADPTGRPLSMLSFLLDANDWPADPWPFLRTNVLLHLLNGALLFALLRQSGNRLDGASRRNDAAALLGAGLWLLHPLFVSTTLYIVQREAMLPATFALLGLLAWGHGRALLAQAPRAGAAWMIGGIGLGTLLAMLCKANGALLPLLAWVLDATVYRRDDDTPLARRLRALLLVLPGLLLFGYVLSKLAYWSEPLQSRPWTIGQRVLTEPRVLLDYLRLLVVPRVLSTGVYNDGYAWSRDWLHPASTLFALLAVPALLAAGFASRRRAPALAAALLFFFAGHLLESTTIPLELYFEHRNYLPAMLLGWPLARALVHWRVEPLVRWLLAAVLLVLLGGTTWMRASLWADQPRMADLWLALNPGSSRAIATKALFDLHAGKPALAMTVLSEPWRKRPHDLQLALNYISASCMLRGPTPAKVDAAAEALRNATEGDQLAYRWLGEVLEAAQRNACPGVDAGTVERWTRAALANPRMASMPGRRQDLHAVLGRVALARGDAAAALREFRSALDAWPSPDAAAQEAALLASNGHPAEGLALLDHYDSIAPLRKQASGWNMPRVHAWVLERQGYWPREFAELRRKMRQDLAAPGAGSRQ
jgi:tetratricopeptide (TPR) repeat protein